MVSGVSVVIPVCNEAGIISENSRKILDYVLSITPDCEIVFVENGSTDDTLSVIESLSSKEPRIRYLSTGFKDLGEALSRGFRAARYSLIVWYPIDLAFNLSFISDCVRLSQDCDIILGSKTHKDSKQVRPKGRILLSKAYNTMTRLLFGLRFSDTQSVKAFRREPLMRILDKTISRGIVFEVELLINAADAGLKVCEIPVEVRDTRTDSKIDLRVVFNAFVSLFKLKARMFFWRSSS